MIVVKLTLFQVPHWMKEGESLSLLETEKSKSKRNNKPYHGFSFRVMRFPIIMEGIGILTSALSSIYQDFNVSRLIIDVKDRYSEEIVNSVSFNKSDLRKPKLNGFTFKPFNNKNLPTVDFDGVLSLRMENDLSFKFPSKLCNAVYDYTLGTHGLVHINGLVDTNFDTILPFSKYSCPLVSLKYRILDVISLKRHIGAKATQNSVEGQRTSEFKRLLYREEEDHNDLIFLPVLDSKFNDSQKVKLYSKYVTENLSFDYLLLTEDSSFVFINNILPKLEKNTASKLWWSDFDVFKKTGDYVENYVDKYTSLTYPPLPKSSTMLLSHHQVEYIARNHLYLKQFGTLQVSIGVWMSSIETKRLQDDFWNVKNCHKNVTFGSSYLACSGLDPNALRSLWDELRRKF